MDTGIALSFSLYLGGEPIMAQGRDTILVVTPDEGFARALEKHLSQNGYEVCMATDAKTALAQASRSAPALVLIDRREHVIGALRRDAILARLPFIVVQPAGVECSDEECLVDLEKDVDAVICTPGYRELIARMRAILRRERQRIIPQSSYVAGALRLDVDRHEVTVGGKAVELTPKEFRILHQLLQYPSRVFSRNELLDLVWGQDCALEEHTLDIHIHSLRHKIEADPNRPRVIVTVRGIGYKLQVVDDPPGSPAA